MSLDAVLRHARPPSPLVGRLSAQSLLFALGEGTAARGVRDLRTALKAIRVSSTFFVVSCCRPPAGRSRPS